jgi:hypothetical protein
MSKSSYCSTPHSRHSDPNRQNTMECPECWRSNSCLSTICQCGFHLANFRKEQFEITEKHKLKSRSESRKRLGRHTVTVGISCIVFIEWQGIENIAWQLLPYAIIATGIALLCTLTEEI